MGMRIFSASKVTAVMNKMAQNRSNFYKISHPILGCVNLNILPVSKPLIFFFYFFFLLIILKVPFHQSDKPQNGYLLVILNVKLTL